MRAIAIRRSCPVGCSNVYPLRGALAVDPDIIFMDEPLGALDALTRINLQDEISRTLP